MATDKPLKKTGTIEIRVADEVKAAFAARCREEERTISDALRTMIDERLAERPARRRHLPWSTAIAGVVGAALGLGVAAPSLARSSPHSRAAFERLDRNHDGSLSLREFGAR